MPNIVVFLADDQGWGDLSFNGNKNLQTPHIDSIAKNGASFSYFYVCPVCSPTRAEFLTGRYHVRGGVWNVSKGGERLKLTERTIADFFRQNNYITAAFGKWHNGSQYPYHPLGRGFQEFYGFCSGHWGDYYSPPLEYNGEPVQGSGYLADDLTNHAIEFIEEHAKESFFCYVPFNTPHSPMQIYDRFYDQFKDAPLPMRGTTGKEDLAFTKAALAMCENIDWNVGRVLKKLDELQLTNSTIVVYFSDNGPNSDRWNGNMKGRKGSVDEGGLRSPLHIQWPGKIHPGTKIEQIAGAIDLFPTLAGLAGVGNPNLTDQPFDGMNLAPQLLGEKKVIEERILLSHWSDKVSARSQKFRLAHDGGLYEIAIDPEQKQDLSKEQTAEKKRLESAVASFRTDLLSSLRRYAERIPVGYADFPLTIIPAQEGTPAGNMKQSAKAPNCSYFTNWKSKDDYVTWPLFIAQRGTYEIFIEYACPAADVGSEIDISYGRIKKTFTLKEAHDPPLIGQEHDRVPRVGESYMKNFRTLSVGKMVLPLGEDTLSLQARKIPGSQVMELRAVHLKLVK